MIYKECEFCGATLDAGETCDCADSQAFTAEDMKKKIEVLQKRRKTIEDECRIKLQSVDALIATAQEIIAKNTQ